MQKSILSQVKTELQIRNQEILDYLSYVFNNQSNLPKHRFIILAQYRTGSTLLADLLNSHPDIFTDEEIFFPFAISSHFKKVLFPYTYINAQSIKSQSKIYGFDLKIDQLIMSLSKFYGSPIEFIQNLVKHQWKIIYLKRNNILRKVISSMCAITRDQYTNTEKNPLIKMPVYIDCKELITRLEWVEKMDKKEEQIIIQKIPCLSVIYEQDLLDSIKHQTTLDRIFNYLGTYSVPVQSKLNKISKSLSDDIHNYEEVANFLRQTKYSSFLETH